MKKVFIGVILICIVVLMGYLFMGPGYAKVTVKEEKEIDIKNIKVINFETTAADVEIKPGPTNSMTVKLEGNIQKKLKDKFRLKIVKEDDLLKVSYMTNENRLGFKFGSEKNVTLQVILPERIYRELSVYTTSGDIDMRQITAENIKLKTTSGDQNIEKIKSQNNISIKSSSGNVDIEELGSLNGQINTKSGKVTMILEEMISTLDIVTTSGDVKTTFRKNPKSLKIDFKGNSGKPDIRLKNIMYEDKDENSVIGVIGNGMNTLIVKTSSGDLTVR